MNISKNNCNFWRVICTFLIAILHTGLTWKGHWTGWYIAVEFFFLLSGFWLAEGVSSGKYTSTPWKYEWNRISKLYPHIIFSFVVFYLYLIIHKDLSLGGILSVPVGHLNEIVPFIFPFSVKEIFGGNYNFPVWYVNVLITVSLVIYYLLKYHRTFFLNIFAPIAALLSYFYMFNNNKDLNAGAYIFGKALNEQYLLGLGGMCLGSLGYFIVLKMKSMHFSILAYIFFRIIEYGTFSLVIILSFLFGPTKLDWLYVLLLFWALIVMNIYDGEHRIISRLPLVNFFSSISYAIYLNHSLLILIHNDICSEWSVRIMVIYIVVLVVYSTLTTWFVKKLTSATKKIIHHFIIVPENV